MKAVIHPHALSASDFKQCVEERSIDVTVTWPQDEDAFLDELADADVLVTGPWDDAYLEYAGELRWIQAVSAGYDHFPVDTFHDHGIRLTNASGVHPKPIAEHVYGYIFGIERRLFLSQDDRRSKEWNRRSPDEVHGKTLGIIGVGAIGKEIARKAPAFELSVLGLDPYPDHAFHYVDRWHDPGELDDLLEQSDYVVLACPLNTHTDGLIGRSELDTMKDSAVLINIGRGGLVDEPALITALQDGTLRAAALDVFAEEPLPEDSPLWELENCVMTPHNSGRTPHYARRVAKIFVENLQHFRADREMPTEIAL